MHIYPINHFTQNQTNAPYQNKIRGVNFKHFHIQDAIPPNILCTPKEAALKIKHFKYNFGESLSSKLLDQMYLLNKDFSDFTLKLRESIIAAGFVSYAQNQSSDTDLETSCANTYLADKLTSIISDSTIVGEDTLLYATNFKRQRFEELITAINSFRLTEPNKMKDMLIEKINPTQSEKYVSLDLKKNVISAGMKSNFSSFYEIQEKNKAKILDLQSQIKNLKQNFSQEAKSKIKSLYAEITKLRLNTSNAKPKEFLLEEQLLTEIKAKQNQIIKESIKDPQEKIKLFYLYKTLLKENIDGTDSINHFFKSHTNQEESELLKEHIKQAINSFLHFNNKEYELFYDLKINESPYLLKILEANTDTSNNLKQLITILANSDKSIHDTLEDLEHNKVTRKLFEAQGYDYDTWIRFDKDKDVLKYVDGQIIIKKVDMTNLKHSLFLGNQVGCCTSIGSGSRAQFAPNYIMCNFVQAIELVDEGKPVGNTMCYIAQNEQGQNIMVLDNIEVLPPYKNDTAYLQMFLDYARKLCSDIGACDIPIYIGARNKFKFDDKKGVGPLTLKVLGSSGQNEMYLDSLQQTTSSKKEPLSPDKNYIVHLMYKLS